MSLLVQFELSDKFFLRKSDILRNDSVSDLSVFDSEFYSALLRLAKERTAFFDFWVEVCLYSVFVIPPSFLLLSILLFDPWLLLGAFLLAPVSVIGNICFNNAINWQIQHLELKALFSRAKKIEMEEAKKIEMEEHYKEIFQKYSDKYNKIRDRRFGFSQSRQIEIET